MSLKMRTASKAIKTSPNKALANDRTLLPFVRTALGLVGGGVGLAKYVGDFLLSGVGYVLILAGGFFLIAGMRRYFRIQDLLTEFGADVANPVK